MEYLDIVDKEDKVIGTAPKEEIYVRCLLHRIVHVLIFNDKDELALQLRTKNLNWCPGHWSTTVGGHVQAGETYEQGALREYQEELGTTSNLELFSKDYYSVEGIAPKFIVTFKTVFNGPFHPDADAVERVDFFSIYQLKQMIASGEKFHPELLFLLNKYFF